MKYFFSYLLCTLSVYFPHRILSAATRIDRNTKIDELINKILQSDKFDEIADKIAERAVEKIKSLHEEEEASLRKKEKANDSLIYRVSEEKDYSIKDDIVTSKLKDNMIALISHEPSPFGNLSLKYKQFFKKKSYESEIEQKYPKEINNEETTVTNKSNNKKGIKKKKLKRVKNNDNRDENMSPSSESQDLESTSVNKNGTKTKSERDKDINSNSTETDGDNNRESLRTVISESTNEIYYKGFKENNNISMPINTSKDKDVGESSEDTDTDVSRNETDDDRISVKNSNVASNNTQEKRTFGKENARMYVLESSSEYDEYREKIYDTIHKKSIF